MRVRNVTTILGLGAFVLVCLAPELAQAQLLRRGNSAPTYYPTGPAYGQSWQPGYYGSPQSYWPGTAYGPGMSYAPGVSYGAGTVPLPAQAGGAGMSYAPGVSYGAPMYQPQPYGYQSPGAPCPPAQPISPSALGSAPPQAMPSGAPGGATPQPMPGGPGAAPAQPAAANTVNAQDDFFEPKTLNIQPGATVTWTNRGQHAHTVTFDVGRDSGDIAPGGSFSATFPHAGTYTYYCRHHKDMRATVVVGEGSGSGGAGGSTGAKY